VGAAVVLHALGPPEDLAVRGVVADEAGGLGADDLVLAGDLDDDRGAPRSHVAFAVGVGVAVALDGLLRLPERLAAGEVEGGDEDALPGPAVEDDAVLVEDGRVSVAPGMAEFAEVPLPELLAVQVVAEEPGGVVEDDDALAVATGVELEWGSCRGCGPLAEVDGLDPERFPSLRSKQ
jgi:hypothetical protein